MSKKAYSYIRFSTPEQLKGDSLRRQLESSRKYLLHCRCFHPVWLLVLKPSPLLMGRSQLGYAPPTCF